MNDILRQNLIDSFSLKEDVSQEDVDQKAGDQQALVDAIDLFLLKVAEAGFVIVPVSSMIATDVNNFEMVIRQWVVPSIEKVGEEDVEIDIPVEAIIQDLRQKGWFILPPRS